MKWKSHPTTDRFLSILLCHLWENLRSLGGQASLLRITPSEMRLCLAELVVFNLVGGRQFWAISGQWNGKITPLKTSSRKERGYNLLKWGRIARGSQDIGNRPYGAKNTVSEGMPLGSVLRHAMKRMLLEDERKHKIKPSHGGLSIITWFCLF